MADEKGNRSEIVMWACAVLLLLAMVVQAGARATAIPLMDEPRRNRVLFECLADDFPAGVDLTAIAIDRNDVMIVGHVRDAKQIAETMENLTSDRHFAKAMLNEVTRASNTTVFDFRISLTLR